MAAIYSCSAPLIDTVAILVCTVTSSVRPPEASAPASVDGQGARPGDEAQHHVDRIAAQARERFLGAEVAPEDLGEGRAVRDVEEAERADLPVQLDGVDARAEHPVGDSPLVDPGDVIDGGHVEVPDRL